MTDKEYETLKEEIEKLQLENAAWQQEFNTLLNFRSRASSLENDGKLLDAIEEYSKSLAHGENSLKLNVNNYAHDIERLIILYNKTKQKDTLVYFLKVIIERYPNYRDVTKWTKRLLSLTNTKGK